MKSIRYDNAFLIKRKNKRTLVLKDKNAEEVAFVTLKIFEKDEGHFARDFEERGVKGVTIRLTEETLETLVFAITEYLKDQRKL